MTTVNLTIETKRKFVMEYAEKVFKKRLVKVGNKALTVAEVQSEMAKQLRAMFPKLNDGESKHEIGENQYKEKVTRYVDTRSDYAKTHGVLCSTVAIDIYREVCNTPYLESGYLSLWPSSRDRWSYSSEYTGYMETVLAFSNFSITNWYKDEKDLPVKEWVRVPYACVDSSWIGKINQKHEGDWPVRRKKKQNPETGEVGYELVFKSDLKPIVSEAKRKRAIRFTEKVLSNLEEYNELLREMGDFVQEMWKVIKPVRTVKRLQDDWPELWPEFKQITALDPEMSGKALAQTADVSMIMRQIADYKGVA